MGTEMYLPDELVRIGRRFSKDPKGEAIGLLIGIVFILLTLPVLHLFFKGTFALTEFLNSF
jgi:hypothetical protein